MNKFKSLLVFCMGFAFMAFPLNNPVFCNGDPLVDNFTALTTESTSVESLSLCTDDGQTIEDFSPCTATITITIKCNPAAGTVDICIEITVSTGDAASATVSGSGGFSGSGSIATSNGTIIVAGAPDNESYTISVNITGSGCDAATIPAPNNPYTPNCCPTCYPATPIAVVTGTDACAANPNVDEICGNPTEVFHFLGDAAANVTIGCIVSRDITFHHNGDLWLGWDPNTGMPCDFEVFNDGNTTFTTSHTTASCTPFAPDNNLSSFTTPFTDVEVKIAPNPVTNIATISYELPEEGTTQVSVFDLKGNRIAVIASGYQAAGVHTLDFDASNLVGGFYYLTVQTANTQVTERMVIVK